METGRMPVLRGCLPATRFFQFAFSWDDGSRKYLRGKTYGNVFRSKELRGRGLLIRKTGKLEENRKGFEIAK
jgi:hypothetical protein